ncbi:uncharacterized protein [Primulina huaijiensis]|uniref:uncharacterized protein isoform X1 n=1 Tax=Primulina huaijiensis TaxID=1492673 RepID=UPI003CC6FA39
MEVVMSSNDLQILTDRSRDLFGKISEIIDEDGFSFCCHCSNHGRYCVVANNTLDEREKQHMIAIRDCIHDFHTILVSLQARKSSEKRQRDEALSRLEESRIHLTDIINRCSERERKLEVLEELITFLENCNFEGEITEDKADEKIVNGVSSFLVNATKFAFEFVVAFAGIYSSIQFYNNRHHRKQVAAAPVESRTIGKLERSANDNLTIHLDVLRGRG